MTTHSVGSPLYSENIFLRKVFCGHCGYAMRRLRSSRTLHQLKCETRTIYNKKDCVLVSIREDVLKNVLLRELNNQATAFGSIQPIELESRQSQNADKVELQNLKSQINITNRFMEGLYESLSQGDIDSDEYRTMKATYETKLEVLMNKERDLRNELLNRAAKTVMENEAISNLNEVRHINDLTAETLSKLVKRITVYEDKCIEIQFEFTDEIICIDTKEVAAQ